LLRSSYSSHTGSDWFASDRAAGALLCVELDFARTFTVLSPLQRTVRTQLTVNAYMLYMDDWDIPAINFGR
jgi:hypothetical protein